MFYPQRKGRHDPQGLESFGQWYQRESSAQL